MSWICYIICNEKGRTYVGVTNNMTRRLRQHNELICGGAKSTRGKGPWFLSTYVHGFPDQSAALKFEWRMHHPQGHRKSRTKGGIENRLKELYMIMNLPKFSAYNLQLGD